MRTIPLLLLIAITACDDDEPSCADPRYNDGTCDIELSCAAPDLDCITTFPDQRAAQAWYEGEPREGHPTLPATDRRFTAMNALLLEGWEAYKQANEVADLDQHVPQLVLIDKDDPNAFVKSDSTKKAGLVVMVNRGLIDLGRPDEEVLGVVMHELEHVIALHVVPGVKERVRKHYLAAPDLELIGADQADDPVVRDHLERWLAIARGAGHFSDLALRGLPFTGVLGDTFKQTIVKQNQDNPTGCAASLARYNQLVMFLATRLEPVSGGLLLENTNVATVIPDVLSQLQAECFAGFTPDAIAVVAAINKLDPVMFRASIPAAKRMQIEGRPYVQGIYNWVSIEREDMRAIEAELPDRTGAAWVRLRYFSTEEAADDSSVYTLHAAGLPPTGMGNILMRLQDGLEPLCRPLVEEGRPIPYGENLVDDHHGTCWRAGHIRDVAERVQNRAIRRRAHLGPPPAHPPRIPVADVTWLE